MPQPKDKDWLNGYKNNENIGKTLSDIITVGSSMTHLPD